MNGSASINAQPRDSNGTLDLLLSRSKIIRSLGQAAKIEIYAQICMEAVHIRGSQRLEKSAAERTCWVLVAVLGIALAGCSGPRSDPASIEAASKYAVSLLSENRFQAPVGWRWGTFVNADGARLRYGWAEPQGNRKGLIVLLPAYQTTAEALFETSRDLLNAGYAIWVLDRRGQGGSDRWLENPQKNYSIGVEHDEHDVEQFVLQVVHGEPNDAHFLVGESLGGHIGFRVLHDYPGYFQAAAFSSPSIAFHTGKFPEWLVRAITRL